MSETKFEVTFYESSNGESPVWDFLEGLRLKMESSKDARIQFKQVNMYIELLSQNGTNLNENITKHFGRRYLGTTSRKQSCLLLLRSK